MVFTDSDCEADIPHYCYGANDENKVKELWIASENGSLKRKVMQRKS